MSGALVAVTGADGFIGRAFCAHASARGRALRRVVRTASAAAGDVVAIDFERAGDDALARALERVDTVVHLAGRAHRPGETGARFEAVYRDANARVTRRLANAAVAAGVRRFIFASTVKVNGEQSLPGVPFRAGDVPAPQDPYARSKRAAEDALLDVARDTAMDAVVLRLPLVYGPGVRGNFRALVDAVQRRRLLPVGAIDNRRSLLGVDSLAAALDEAIDATAALRGVYLLADVPSVSTPGLVRAIADALGVAPRLADVPVPLLRIAATLSGRGAAVARLAGSLEVDPAPFAAATRWTPRATLIDAATVADRPSDTA